MLLHCVSVYCITLCMCVINNNIADLIAHLYLARVINYINACYYKIKTLLLNWVSEFRLCFRTVEQITVFQFLTSILPYVCRPFTLLDWITHANLCTAGKIVAYVKIFNQIWAVLFRTRCQNGLLSIAS